MTGVQGLMTGKRGLVMGVANDRSIAWGIARVLAGHGAKLAQGQPRERLRSGEHRIYENWFVAGGHPNLHCGGGIVLKACPDLRLTERVCVIISKLRLFSEAFVKFAVSA